MILWNPQAEVKAKQRQIRDEQGGHRALSDLALSLVLFIIIFLTYILG